MKSRFLILISLLCVLSCSKNNEHILTSPNGNIRLFVSNQDSSINFLLIHNNDTIIKKSALGLLVNGSDFTNNVAITEYTEDRFDETWTSINGKNYSIRNNYKEYKLRCSKLESEKDFYDIIFRLYNDGFAYRYLLFQKLLPTVFSLIRS